MLFIVGGMLVMSCLLYGLCSLYFSFLIRCVVVGRFLLCVLVGLVVIVLFKVLMVCLIFILIVFFFVC